MAERPARPAVLAGGWRSRPGVVRVAAAFLGLFGVLLMLVEADEGQPGVEVVVTGLVLLVTAAALVWAGRLGYWLGLTVAALVALLLVVALTRHPKVAGVIVTAVGALPLILLLVPAARRPPGTAKPSQSSPAAAAAPDQSQGWRRPYAGWGQFALMLVAGGLLSVGGLAMALTSRGADRAVGATIALFFLACCLTAPLFAPLRRRGRLRLETMQLGGRHERGIVVPYSGPRTAVLLAAIACLALACLGFVVFADAFADDSGESPWPVRVVGTVGAVFFGLGARWSPAVAGAAGGGCCSPRRPSWSRWAARAPPAPPGSRRARDPGRTDTSGARPAHPDAASQPVTGTLLQRGEERAGAQLLGSVTPSHRPSSQHAGAVAVALGLPVARALMGRGTMVRGRPVSVSVTAAIGSAPSLAAS